MGFTVIQWGTGAIGKTCLRQVIDRPDLELVGLFVHSERKQGLDAGVIARRPETGVIATNDIDALLALDADCVLHLPLAHGAFHAHDETVKRILRSGKNVISTVAYTYPRAHGDGYAADLESACLDGGATLFGTGINPGFVMERLAVGMTGACSKVDSIVVTEGYDISEMQSAAFVFDQIGAGRRVDEVTGTHIERLYRDLFAESLSYVAQQLGVRYDRIEADHEFGLAPDDIVLAAGTVAAGRVVNFRWRWHGIVAGTPFVTIQLAWVGDRTLPGWEVEDGWTLQISGAPGFTVKIDLVEPVGLPDRTKAMQYAVASPVINAIPVVCQAPAGILVLPSFAPWRAS